MTGRLAGRPGSFVLRHDGTFDATTVRARIRVVDGTGTGELAGLTGEGSIEAASTGGPYPYVLGWDRTPATADQPA